VTVRDHGGWRRRLVGLGLVAILTGCQLEVRPPSGSRRDDAAMQRAVDGFYGALAARDTAALEAVAFTGGSALLDATGRDVTLVPMLALLRVPERRSTGTPPRVVHTEFRVDGNTAVARVVLTAPAGGGIGEVEASDLLTLGRRDGTWRIAHTQFGAWRIRSAP
jgi:hypothetical protein